MKRTLCLVAATLMLIMSGCARGQEVFVTPASTPTLPVISQSPVETYEPQNPDLLFAPPDEDVRGVPYIDAAELESGGSMSWSIDWEPWQDTYENYMDLLLPQAWQRTLTMQDICARYYDDNSSYDSERFDTEKLYDLLKSRNEGDNQYLENNLRLLERLIQAQKNKIIEITPDIDVHVDMNYDGTDEEIRIEKTEYKNVECVGQLRMLYKYEVIFNGQPLFTLYNSEILFRLIDLNNCRLLLVDAIGFYEGWYEDDTPINSVVYGYFNAELQLLGELNGRLDLALENGRFTTNGSTDLEPYDNPVLDVIHEYVVREGKLYHVRHDWQQSRDIWLLSKDLWVFEDRSGTISRRFMKKGTRVLIAAYSQNDWLYLINEENVQGYVKLIYAVVGRSDPLALPNGERLSDLFDGFVGCTS